MLTYRTGAAGAPSAAMAMAAHLLEQTLPRTQAELATYYQRGLVPAADGAADTTTVAEPRRDMDPRLAALLGLDPNRVPGIDQIAQVLAGNRADGGRIPRKQVQRATASLAEELGLDAARAPDAAEIAHVLAGYRANGQALPAERAAPLRARLLDLYGVPDGTAPSAGQLAHIQAGRRADGEPLRLGPLLDGLSASRARIGYVDLCWSADKSVSLAWAFAPTEAERNIIAQAHKDAVNSALAYVQAELGRARKGKAGRDGYEAGQIGWISFDHYASRPTVEFTRTDRLTGAAYTELVTLKVAGDPQLHTHVAIPNVVLTEGGRVGALDMQRLKGRVHEFGAYYQAHLATNLRRHGVEVVLDEATGAARLTAIPERVRDAYSKRTRNGTDAARAYARTLGLDWDALDDARKIGLAKRGVQGDPRQAKQDDLGDFVAWRAQAAALGWSHRSVLAEAAEKPVPSRAARLEHAYSAALGLFDKSLQRRAVTEGAEARVAAARGLIAAGVESPADIDAVTEAFSRRGVRQDGRPTTLIAGTATDEYGQDVVRLTTALHAEREAEFLARAQAAASDRTAALPSSAIVAAVARCGTDFDATEHGRAQRAIIDRLGQGGRLAVAIGVAGAGKSTLLAPLVDAWQAEGRTVFGAALAWRQTDDLEKAGIPEARRAAMSVFLERAQAGRLALDRDSVVVVDELALLGTRQMLDLLRLQAAQGFQLVAVGDPKQCQSIEAGPVIDLLRRALGREAVPEILTTVRQQTERERTASLLFREGRADEALAMKRDDGSAKLITGDYRQVVDGIAALWQERRAAHAGDADYTLSVSAPTNRDAREIGAAIRLHRRAAGELGRDQVVLSAVDQTGETFELPLAVGDRVRLFARTNAAYPDRSRGIIGNNGSVLEVRGIDGTGVVLRNAQGREGRVAWNTLRDEASQRIRLTYGDVLSIDATQGLTSTEHIEAMPAGTRAVNAYKAYTAASRHRRATFLVTSEGAERREIAARRPLGDARPIREADVWANMGRNLSRQPKAISALAFLETARDVRRDATHALQAGLRAAEQRQADGLEATTLVRTVQRRRIVERVAETATQLTAWTSAQGAVLVALGRVVPAMHAAVAQAMTALRPALQDAAGRIAQRPERVRRRQKEAELAAGRERLLAWRMKVWWNETLWGRTISTPAMEAQWKEQAKVEEARQRAAIAALPEKDLRQAVRLQEAINRRREQQRERQAARIRGPTPGM
jgi:hypothetical protein